MTFDPTTQSRQDTGEFGYRKFPKDKVDISDDEQAISGLASIGTNTHISNSTIDDATIRDGAKIINSNVGNDTNVGANTFVLGSDLAESNEIGADSSIVSSKLDTKRGHIGILDHVSITASKIGQGAFIGPYTNMHNSTVGKTCSFEGHSLILNSNIGDNSVFGEMCDMQGANIASGVKVGNDVSIGNDVAIMQDCVLMPKVQIDEGTRIGPGVIISRLVHIGEGVTIGPGSWIDADADIRSGVVIGAGVAIGEGAFLNSNCVVADGAIVPSGTFVQSGETFHSRT
jgi:UDP-3-O-[3-hydroxymyristoyl] glucosamine N-acyltransferase